MQQNMQMGSKSSDNKKQKYKEEKDEEEELDKKRKNRILAKPGHVDEQSEQEEGEMTTKMKCRT